MKILVIISVCLVLSSCAMHLNNRMSFAQAERVKWQPLALKQDADAQFKLGNAYCCGESGFFETKKAIDWWCKASKQGHVEAKQALARYDRNGQCS